MVDVTDRFMGRISKDNYPEFDKMVVETHKKKLLGLLDDFGEASHVCPGKIKEDQKGRFIFKSKFSGNVNFQCKENQSGVVQLKCSKKEWIEPLVIKYSPKEVKIIWLGYCH